MGPRADNRLGRAQEHQDAAMLVIGQQILPSSRQSVAQEGLEAWVCGQQGGCPGNLGAGMLSRTAGELMSQRSPQNHGGRAAWKPTHSDAHPWSRAVGEGSHLRTG